MHVYHTSLPADVVAYVQCGCERTTAVLAHRIYVPLALGIVQNMTGAHLNCSMYRNWCFADLTRHSSCGQHSVATKGSV